MRKLKPFLHLVILSLSFAAGQSRAETPHCLRAAEIVLSNVIVKSQVFKELNQELLAFTSTRGRKRIQSLRELSLELEEAVKSFPKNTDDIDRDAEFLGLVRKIVFSKSPQILEKEIAALQKDPSYVEAIRMAIRFRWLRQSVFESTAATFRLLAGQESKWFHFLRANNPQEFFSYLYWDVGHRALETVSPFPLPLNRAPTASIFRKLWRDNAYVPTFEEIGTLKRFNALKLFEDQRAFQMRNPNLSTMRRWIGNAADLAKFLSFVALGVHAYEMSQGGFLSVDEFLAQPRSKTGNDVFLLMDTVPLPHMALMMNNKVYSYGQTHLTVKDPVSYLKEREIHQLMKDRGLLADIAEAPPTTSSARIEAWGEQALGNMIQAAGLDKLPQSMEVVALRLTNEELDRVSRELESHRAVRYENFTMVNDCATMIIRVLSKNTWVGSMRLVDASPSQIVMAFSAEKYRGEKRVTDVFQMTIEKNEQVDTHFERNLWINAMESKLFINFFWINQIHRLYLDVTMSKKLQAHDPATTQIMLDEWPEDAVADLKADDQIALFEEQSLNLESVKDLGLLRESVETYFKDLIDSLKTEAENGATDLRTRSVNLYKIEMLKTKQREIRTRIDEFVDPGTH